MVLSDQVALVTGAGQGIGKATALALAGAGAHVAVVDINGQQAEETGSAVMALGPRGLALQADVGNLQDIDRMVRQTVETFGKVDILVNNAGVTRRAYIMDLTEEDWDRIHRVNAKGVFFCLQRVAREMMPQRRPTVSSLLIPVASHNLLLLQSLPTGIQHRQVNAGRRKDEHRVGTAARGIMERLSRLPRCVHPPHRPSGRVCCTLSTRA